VGDGKGSAVGVLGRNSAGAGVEGQGKNGVIGKSSVTSQAAVCGQNINSGQGYGVVGDGAGTGAGVLGRGSTGYGGQFSGNRAQLMLVPASTVGKPTTGAHVKGELYMDSATTLFVCTVNGTPGTWRRVTTVA